MVADLRCGRRSSVRGRIVAALVPSLMLGALASAQDLSGTADPPGLKRITGSQIVFQSRADFDRLTLALEKIVWDAPNTRVRPFRSETVEGQRVTTYYRLPDRMLPIEALRNYEQELRAQGFQILFSGVGEAIETVGYNNQIAREVLGMKGVYSTPEERAQWPFQHTDEARAAYFAARGRGPHGGERYVSGYFAINTQGPWEITRGMERIPQGVTLARIDLIDVQAREQRMTLVTSAEMAQAIGRDGRVALYGIYFAHDSATIQPEAEPTLAEIAKLMRERPQLQILVVGHTDTQGSFDYNRGLSQRRAEAVVARLAQLGVDRRRLHPVGVGFAAPVATNATEEGRAKNRRVELVDLAGGRIP
ncbi:MAG: OmpA family protein [Casimicrobiaceae bacterium]|nr:OmpA family protein [Casimicrobiaceae bacterium]MDW8312115.1 OmpA family protein [Burkholderiales bacterium]